MSAATLVLAIGSLCLAGIGLTAAWLISTAPVSDEIERNRAEHDASKLTTFTRRIPPRL